MEGSELDGYLCWQLQPIWRLLHQPPCSWGPSLVQRNGSTRIRTKCWNLAKIRFRQCTDIQPSIHSSIHPSTHLILKDPMPEQQRLWDGPLIDHDKAIVWNGCGDSLGQARLRALMAPHAGVWLQTIPLTACGLGLDNEAVRVAARLRLGLTLCAPH